MVMNILSIEDSPRKCDDGLIDRIRAKLARVLSDPEEIDYILGDYFGYEEDIVDAFIELHGELTLELEQVKSDKEFCVEA